MHFNNIDLTQLRENFDGSEWPEFLSVEADSSIITIAMHVSSNVRWFEGHFPGNPVLPGVVQTHWACVITRHFLAQEQPFVSLQNLKFQSVILPEANISLRLSAFEDKPTVEFKYFHEDTDYSAGRIRFG